MTLGSHFLVQRGSPLMGIARAEKPRIETLPAKRFHTWGNSGLEPYLGSGNQLSSIDEAQHGLCKHGGTAMEHYVGLDVSLKLTAICIVIGQKKLRAREWLHPVRKRSPHSSNRMRHMSRGSGLRREQRQRGYGPS